MILHQITSNYIKLHSWFLSIYMQDKDRPQPRRDTERENGMAVFVGRLRPCPVFDYKFIALGHNTVRGAAGAAVLNAELMYSEGLLD